MKKVISPIGKPATTVAGNIVIFASLLMATD
jgi:hypothetical protein